MTGQSIATERRITSRRHGARCVFRKTIGNGIKERKTNNERRIIMEVKNGIIIDGVLHEAIIKSELDNEFYCEDCSLYSFCHGGFDERCAMFSADGFVIHGKVKIDKEE
jgi:hypothetical protein